MMKLERMIRYSRACAGVLASFLLFPGLLYAGLGISGYKVEQIAVSGATYTFPSAVNTSRTVVGNFATSGGVTEGFELKGNVYTTLVFPGSNNFTRANGINDSNVIVGDFQDSSNIYHGFIYDKKKYTQYDVPGSANTSLLAVNNLGNMAGSAAVTDAGNKGFVVIDGTATEFYADGNYATFAYGINNSNESAGTYFDYDGVPHGFYRDASGNITFITFPGSQRTGCQGINDSGVITGYYQDASGEYHGFLYSAGTYTQQSFYADESINNAGDLVGLYIGPGSANGVQYGFLAIPKTFCSYSSVTQIPGAQSTEVFAINNNQAQVGVYTDSTGTTHGLLYQKSKVTNIDDPNAQTGSTIAFGINNSGQIVGAYTNGSGVGVGFLYSGGSYTDIAPPGSQGTYAQGINDSGAIVGLYVNSSGAQLGFIFDGSTYKDINAPGSQWTAAWGINNSGEVTLQWGDQYGFFRASLYNGSTFTPLTVPLSVNTGVHSINSAGDIVFVWGDPYGNNHGALLNAGSYFVFDLPASLGTGTDADGINDSGAIVGHFTPTGTSVFGAYEGKL